MALVIHLAINIKGFKIIFEQVVFLLGISHSESLKTIKLCEQRYLLQHFWNRKYKVNKEILNVQTENKL